TACVGRGGLATGCRGPEEVLRMRCQVFEFVVVALARGSAPLDDRGEALEHAEGCERCRARLEAERTLSAELRALAAAEAGLAAPLRVAAELSAPIRCVVAPR